MSNEPTDAALSTEEQGKALEWLRSKSAEHPLDDSFCSTCGGSSWTVEPKLGYVMSGSLGGQVYPCVVAICDGCGKTEFYNAIKMGLERPAAKQE